ncbi:PIR protein [Plasmodium vivax]|uniref:VIR protein n=1 Tax=Plasmodium vivax TaxID=5855 RepID=A0A565A3I7_PLAVI|nr:PIR protein [Plasmodium vivax]
MDSSPYEFFNDIKTYLSHNDKLQDAEKLDEHDNSCRFMSSDRIFTDKHRSNGLCERFNYLIDLLTKEKTKDLSKCDKEYLNFWLNDELSTTDNNSPFHVKDFYEKLKQKRSDPYINSLEGKLYNITHEHFENMRIKNNLYKNYGKIFNAESKIVCGIKKNCLEYSNICYSEYKKGLIRCFYKQGNWCQKLSVFKNMYISDNKDASPSGEFSYNDLIDLPRDEDVEYELYGGLNSWKNLAMMISSILATTIGLFFYFYKFSPFGKKFCAKEKRKEKFRHNIPMVTHEFLHAYDNPNKNSNNTYNLHYKSVDFS